MGAHSLNILGKIRGVKYFAEILGQNFLKIFQKFESDKIFRKNQERRRKKFTLKMYEGNYKYTYKYTYKYMYKYMYKLNV